MFYPVDPPPGEPSRGPSRLRRAALPQPFLVPRRRVGTGRPRRARGGARAGRARGHGPPGPLRCRPVLDGGRGGRPPPRDRRGDRARRCGGAGSRRDRGAGPASLATRPSAARRRRASRRRGRPARSPASIARPAARPSSGPQGRPPRDRRGAARAAPRAARPGRDGLAEPVPDGVAGQPRGDEGGAAVHPGAAGRARRGVDRPVGLPGGRAGAAAAGGRPGRREGGGGALRRPVRTRRLGGRERLRARAHAPPAPRRRLARLGDGAPGRGARAARGRHQRRPLRPARGARAPGRPGRDPARPLAARAARPAPAGRRVVPQGRRGAARAAAGRAIDRGRGPRAGAGVAGGDRGLGGDRRGLPGGPRVRAIPLPGLRRAQGGDAVQPPVVAVLGGGEAPLPPDDAGRRAPARPRAGRDREDGPRRVLPDLLGPDAVREVAPHPGAGAGERGGLDRRVRAGDHARRPDPPRAAVRAVHQRGPDGVPGRRHRLQLGAAGGGDPVRLRALRDRAHGDGLQPRHVPGAVGGARGGLRAGLPAAAGRPGREGPRDVRQRDGPPRPRGRGRVRAVLRAAGGGVPAGDAGHRRVAGRRPRPDRRDGPAEPPARRPFRGRGARRCQPAPR